MGSSEHKCAAVRNMISFWVFGMCNNFAYNVMLGAAQDILKRNSQSTLLSSNNTDRCVALDNDDLAETSGLIKSLHNEPVWHRRVVALEKIITRHCAPASAGVVLLCNIVPCLIVKLCCPFFMHHIPYATRHLVICTAQLSSLLVTAWADSVPLALVGVLLASFSCGFGETTYLALASHYSKNTISTWSSGSGMAGFLGTFSYAVLTDVNLLGLTPQSAMLVMLVVPILFTFSYYCLLVRAPTIHPISATQPSTWLDFSVAYERNQSKSVSSNDGEESEQDSHKLEAKDRSLLEQIIIVKGLLKYMIPFGTVYFMQYFIKNGLVFYQIGVFVARSSTNVVKLNFLCISLTAVIQTSLAILVFFTAVYSFIPHFGIVCGLMLIVGLVGGANYANTFYHIHRKVEPTIREFALSTVTLADTIGILAAALSAIPAHNWLCGLKWFG